MNEVQDLVGRVQAARTDPEAADALIRQYMGFIRAETAKFIKRAPIDGQDEELSIAMLAFYEAILGYEQNRGAFLSYASRGIRNRMIDHYRKEKSTQKSFPCMHLFRMRTMISQSWTAWKTRRMRSRLRTGGPPRGKRLKNLSVNWGNSASHFPK